MFNKTKLLLCSNKLVGFREDASSTYDTLTTDQKKSNTGYYFNDLPGLDFEIIESVISKNAISATAYLQGVIESETINIVSQFIENNKANGSTKELLSNQDFTTGVAKFTDTIIQNGRFLGYLITPQKSNNIQATITQLGLQVNALQNTALKVFLYETTQLEAIATFDFDTTKVLSLVWKDVTDFIINYTSKNGGSGSQYLLGYYEKDPNNPQAYQLQGQALKMNFDCGCSGNAKLSWSKYMGIHPIAINNDYLNPNGATYTIPTPVDIWSCVTTQTYGLLAKVNIKCDITDMICTNIGMFSKCVQHAVVVRLLLDAYAGNRINSISDSKREQCKEFAVHYKGIINGYTTTEGVRVKGLIELLTLDFSGLDRYCAPCNTNESKFVTIFR